MTMGGKPIDDYAPDFWLVSDADAGDPIGYLTSPWYAPELGHEHRDGLRAGGQVRRRAPRSRCGSPTNTRRSPGKPERAEGARCRSARRSIRALAELAHSRGEDAAA